MVKVDFCSFWPNGVFLDVQKKYKSLKETQLETFKKSEKFRSRKSRLIIILKTLT